MDDRTEAEIRNAALEEAAQMLDCLHNEYRQYHTAFRQGANAVRDLKSAPADQTPIEGVKLPLLPEAFMSTSEFPGGVYSSSEMQEYGRDCYEVGLSYSQQHKGGSMSVSDSPWYPWLERRYGSEVAGRIIRETIRATLTAQPAASAEYSQFLTDVMTAAGLVSHGKQCKALGERLGAGAMKYRFQAAPAVPTDEQCMEAESVAQGVAREAMNAGQTETISLRDYFAAKALNGMLSNDSDDEFYFADFSEVTRHYAQMAYQYSDAMIRARQEVSHDS